MSDLYNNVSVPKDKLPRSMSEKLIWKKNWLVPLD